jgi:hypothetical protein
MPRAPQLERTVTPTALPGARRQGAETFASSGGLVAQAQEGFGRELASAGLRAFAAVREQERESAAALERLTITRRFNDLDHLLLQDTDRGLLNKTGRAPLDAQDQYVDEWDTTANDMISGEIKTEGGRLFFEQEKERRRDAFLSRVSSHSAQQMRVYRGQELDALLKSSVQAGGLAADPRDPRAGEAVAFQLQVIDDAIDTNAPRLGLGPEQVKAMKEANRSALHVAAVEQLLSKPGRERDARDYFDSVDDQIAAPAAAQLRERLKRSVLDNQGYQLANEIWDSHAPAADDDTTAIQLDRLEALARERSKGDADLYKTISAYLRDRKQGVEDARRQRLNTRDQAIWSSIAQGATATQIRALPEFRTAPGETQIKVLDYLERDALQKENLAASRDARAHAAAQRRARELEDKGYSTYLELKADPERLKGLSDGEIYRMLPDIGPENVNRILNEREQLVKSANAAKNATIDNDLFKDVAYNAGIDYATRSTADMSEKQKARLGRLRATVESEIQRLSAKAPGGVLSNDEKRKVMQGIVDRKVMLDTWGPVDTEAIQATVLDDERGIAYIPVDQVDPLMRARFVDKLRALPSNTLSFGPPPSDDQVVSRYRQRIQRAAALTALGATVRQVDAVLEGKED